MNLNRFQRVVWSRSKKQFLIVVLLHTLLLSAAQAQSFWQRTGGPSFQGRITAISANRADVLFAGTEGGGIFRSDNDGATWQAVNTGLTNLNITAFAIQSNGYVFAGTNGSGVFRSTDDGDTWTQVINGLTNLAVTAMAINSEGRIFAGTDGSGVFASYTGNLWTRLAGGISDEKIRAVAVNSSGHIFAGTFDTGIFRSVDEGASWSPVNSGLLHTRVRAFAINSLDEIWAGTLAGGVYRSTSNGNSWVRVSTGLTNMNVLSLLKNSTDDFCVGTDGGGVFRSKDGGQNWVPMSTGLTESVIPSLARGQGDLVVAGTSQSGIFKGVLNTFVPNLFASAFSFSPNAVEPGGTISLSGTITNNDADLVITDIKINFFLSKNNTGGPDFTRFLHSYTMPPPLGFNESKNFSGELATVPDTTSPGSYCVWLSLDPENTIRESNEEDNLRVSVSTLQVTANPPPPTPPEAPTNLQANAISSTQINLTWNDQSGNETRFRIERKIGTGAFTFLLNKAAGSTNHSDTSLTPGTQYTYRVRAENDAGNSAYSNEASATTPAPPTVTTNAATNIGKRTATLHARVNANLASATVKFQYGLTTSYGSEIAATPSPVIGNNATEVSAVLPDLAANTTYHFRVTASNSAGTSNGSDRTFTTLPNTALHVSAARGNDANPGTASLPVRNIQTALSRASSGDTVKVAAGNFNEGLQPQVQVVLLGGYAEDFSASARDFFLNKTVMRAVSADMLVDSHASTIEGFVFDGNNVAEDALDLRAATVAKHNVIYGIRQGQGRGVAISGQAMLINNTIHNCATAVQITTGAAAAVVKNNLITNNSIGIDNNAANGVHRYNDVYNNEVNYAGAFNFSGVGDISLAPRFLDPAANDFRLQNTSPALDAGDPADAVGEEPAPNGGRIDLGAYGGTKNATPRLLPPVLLTPANSADGQPLTPTLSWQPAAGATSYRLQISTGADFSTTVFDDSTLSATSWPAGPLANNTLYHWRVNAKNNFGPSEFSNVFQFTTASPTLSGVSPASGNRLQTLEVTFTGNNIADDLAINVGADIAINSKRLHSPESLTVNLTIAANAATGPREFSVGASNSRSFTVTNPAPTLASIAPARGDIEQTLDVIFTGSNFFQDATTVNAGNGITVNDITVTNTTSLTANLTITAAADTGRHDFVVINSGPGGGVSASQAFTVNPQTVALAALEPASGERLQTLDVIFSGTNFTEGLAVNVGPDISINSQQLNSPASLTANITIGANAATGQHNFSLGSSNSVAFIVNNPAPILAEISPASGDLGQTLEVVFTGSNFFQDATTVNTGPGIEVNEIVVTSTTSLTANITVTAAADTGIHNFSVSNAAPGGGTSATQTFRVRPQTVTLTSIDPTAGDRLQSLNVVFAGTNFNQNLPVNTGPGITVNLKSLDTGDTSLTANITISGQAATGPRNFSVGTSNSQTFTVRNPAPTLAGLSPAAGDAGQTLDVVFIGTNFFGDATAVNVGSNITVNSITVNSATSLTADLTISAGAARGAREFSVTNSGPGGGTSATQTFTVRPQSVILDSIAPSGGNRLETLEVVFTGANLSEDLAVNVGPNITVNQKQLTDATRLIANITIDSAAATGPRLFSLGTSNSQTFTVSNPAPMLTGIAPDSARIGQTVEVEFSGMNFFPGATTVNVGNGITVNALEARNTTSMVARLTLSTAAALGVREFSVSNASPGGGVSASRNFTVLRSNAAPEISYTPVLSSPNGQSIAISASIIDDNGVAGAHLHYRRAGDPGFITQPMTLAGGNNYRADILANAVTSRGVEYFITATDADNAQDRQPPIKYFSIQIQVSSEARHDEQGNPVAQPAGNIQAAYRLISVPLQLEVPEAHAVLADELGPYDDTKWRLYGLSLLASQNLNDKEPYAELRNSGDLSPGKSLFLIVNEPDKVIVTGAGRSVRTDREFAITLQRGHNFIGAPFNFTIPINKLRLQSGSSVTLRTFAAADWPSATALAPWEGYYVANLNETADILFVDPDLSSGPQKAAPASATSAGGWRVQIMASCAGARDDFNFAGVLPESENGYDGHDRAEPPPIGEYVSLYFPHPEWQKALARFSDDMRSAATPNHCWDFEVASKAYGETVKLQFDLKEMPTGEVEIYLLDPDLQYRQNLRESSIYTFVARGVEHVKKLALVAGEKEFVAEQVEANVPLPHTFELHQNFPNPFSSMASERTRGMASTTIRYGLPSDARVTLRVFNLLGELVATLVPGEAQAAGYHLVNWDGRDARGRPVTAGVYFYQFTANAFSQVRKAVVLR
ncbi:MAG: hypothetical protein DYG95_19285 [Chlorobi bacterium CHB1]|nr:hypothetical protein [Chlorobi bacterium CHB1]